MMIEPSNEIDRVAKLLIAEWERVEGKPVNVSYIATFADMARVVVANAQAPRHSASAGWAKCLVCGHEFSQSKQ